MRVAVGGEEGRLRQLGGGVAGHAAGGGDGGGRGVGEEASVEGERSGVGGLVEESVVEMRKDVVPRECATGEGHAHYAATAAEAAGA